MSGTQGNLPRLATCVIYPGTLQVDRLPRQTTIDDRRCIFVIGKTSDRRQTIGWVIDDRRQTIGWVIDDRRQTIDWLIDDRRQTIGQLIDDRRQTMVFLTGSQLLSSNVNVGLRYRFLQLECFKRTSKGKQNWDTRHNIVFKCAYF